MKSKKEIEDFLATEEGSEWKSYIDGRVMEAIKSYNANHPPVESEAARARIAEKDREIDRLKMDIHLAAECQRLGVPKDWIDELGATFNDEGEATKRLEGFAERYKQKQTGDINEMIRRESFTPGSGSDEERPDLSNISPERAVYHEVLGELDAMIEK